MTASRTVLGSLAAGGKVGFGARHFESPEGGRRERLLVGEDEEAKGDRLFGG